MPLNTAFLPATACIFWSNRNSTFLKRFKPAQSTQIVCNLEVASARDYALSRQHAQHQTLVTTSRKNVIRTFWTRTSLQLLVNFPPRSPGWTKWFWRVGWNATRNWSKWGQISMYASSRWRWRIRGILIGGLIRRGIVGMMWSSGPRAPRHTNYSSGSPGDRAASTAKKGLRVGISGGIGINSWTSADGETRTNIVVTAESFEVLQSRSEPSPGLSNGS